MRDVWRGGGCEPRLSRASTSYFAPVTKGVDGRDISAFTRAFDALCPAMTRKVCRPFRQLYQSVLWGPANRLARLSGGNLLRIVCSCPASVSIPIQRNLRISVTSSHAALCSGGTSTALSMRRTLLALFFISVPPCCSFDLPLTHPQLLRQQKVLDLAFKRSSLIHRFTHLHLIAPHHACRQSSTLLPRPIDRRRAPTRARTHEPRSQSGTGSDR